MGDRHKNIKDPIYKKEENMKCQGFFCNTLYYHMCLNICFHICFNRLSNMFFNMCFLYVPACVATCFPTCVSISVTFHVSTCVLDFVLSCILVCILMLQCVFQHVVHLFKLMFQDLLQTSDPACVLPPVSKLDKILSCKIGLNF